MYVSKPSAAGQPTAFHPSGVCKLSRPSELFYRLCTVPHLLSVHEVKPGAVHQPLSAVRGMQFTCLTLLCIALPCVAAIVCPALRGGY